MRLSCSETQLLVDNVIVPTDDVIVPIAARRLVNAQTANQKVLMNTNQP